MKKYLFLFLILACSLEAYHIPKPTRVSLQGEFLYFTPEIEGDFFSFMRVISGLSTTRNVDSIQPTYAPAFRVVGEVGLWDSVSKFQTRYTRFAKGYSTTVSAPILRIPDFETNFQVVDHDLHFRYYGADFTYNHLLYSSPSFDVAVLAGLHYAWLKCKSEQNATRFAGPLIVNTVRETFGWKVGPEIGIDLDYNFWNRFSLVGDFRASLLLCRQKSEAHSRTRSGGLTTTGNTFYPADLKTNPSIDSRLGLHYDYLCRIFKANVEVGYEFLWYQNAVSFSQIVNTDLSLSSTFFTPTVYSLSFFGPYVAIQLFF